MAGHVIVGATVSCTVTVAVPVATLPFTSVTVSVTVFAPTLAHVKVFGETVIDAMPQYELEPLLTCAAVTEAFPDASNCTVTGCVTTVGPDTVTLTEVLLLSQPLVDWLT